MAGSSGNSARVLALGNELLADDAFGLLVAEELRRRCGPGLDLVCSAASGLHLLDEVLGAERLVVVDAIMTGRAEPGTIYIFEDQQARVPAGPAPHCYGLFDALALARNAGLRAPSEVTIVAVEAADCTTLGGAMDARVRGAVPRAAAMVAGWIREDSHAGSADILADRDKHSARLGCGASGPGRGHVDAL